MSTVSHMTLHQPNGAFEALRLISTECQDSEEQLIRVWDTQSGLGNVEKHPIVIH